MYIMVTQTVLTCIDFKVFKCFRCRIEFVKTCIFCPNPYISIIVFANTTYSFTTYRIFVGYRVILFKKNILFGDVIHTSEISPNPDTTFPIHIHGINHVIRKGKLIIFILVYRVSLSSF
ncbi:hypothetical protein SDC9_159430 [bioreactor metagenome]|uniref:Uncharacterized protein n=1 Tax=bioreactor metagenome TaxID=1076179 RepID=A0A645FCL9_9ZZZZ